MELISVKEFIEFVETYGWKGLLVLTSIMLWRYREKLKLCKFFRRFIRLWLGIDTSRPVKDIPLSYSRIDKLIHEALFSILYNHSACRAWVFEFIGFNDKIKPLPYTYQSCTYEVVNPSRRVSHEKDNLQDMPLSAYREWSRRLVEDLEISIPDIDEVKEIDFQFWSSLSSQKIRGVYGVLLLDFRGTPIGAVGVDYSDGVTQPLNREDDRRRFFLSAVKIAGLVTFKRNGSLDKLVEGL